MSQSQEMGKYGRSYSNERASVTNYRPTDERERKIHEHMKENMKKTPFIKTLAKHEDKTEKRKKALAKALDKAKKNNGYEEYRKKFIEQREKEEKAMEKNNEVNRKLNYPKGFPFR